MSAAVSSATSSVGAPHANKARPGGEQSLIEEDLLAAWSVCGVLITIVSMGALLGIVSVLVIVLL